MLLLIWLSRVPRRKNEKMRDQQHGGSSAHDVCDPDNSRNLG
jgi:hypothetical protein